MSRHVTMRRWFLAAWILLSPLAAGCSRNPATGKLELSLIPTDQEISMGLAAAPEFEQEFGGKVPNDRLQAYVRTVGQAVAEVSERPMPYEFVLVRSDIPNAFALPGGKIFITAGLMSRFTNERQLAGVLAHEVGHVSGKHSVHAMQRQMGADVLAKIAGYVAGPDKAQVAEKATKLASAMGSLHYTRGEEHESDKLAVRYLPKAGYNPWGMVEVLQVLYELSESEPGFLGQMMRTHPLTSDRIDRTRQITQSSHPSYSADAVDPHAQRFLDMRKLLVSTMAKPK